MADYSDIVTRHSTFQGDEPDNLRQGELAVNISDRSLWVGPPGGGAGLRIILSETVSVTQFGAVGDGVTDDTQAFQDTFDYVYERGGGCISIPSGTYIISDQIQIQDVPVKVMGCGMRSSIIRFNDPTPYMWGLHFWQNSFVHLTDFSVESTLNTAGGDPLTFEGRRAIFLNNLNPGSDPGAVLDRALPACIVENIYIGGHDNTGTTGWNYGIVVFNTPNALIRNCSGQGFMASAFGNKLTDLLSEAFIGFIGADSEVVYTAEACSCAGWNRAIWMADYISFVNINSCFFVNNRMGVSVKDTSAFTTGADYIITNSIIQSYRNDVKLWGVARANISGCTFAKRPEGDNTWPYRVEIRAFTGGSNWTFNVDGCIFDNFASNGAWSKGLYCDDTDGLLVVGCLFRRQDIGIVFDTNTLNCKADANLFYAVTTPIDDNSVQNIKALGAMSKFGHSANQVINGGHFLYFNTLIGGNEGVVTRESAPAGHTRFVVTKGVERINIQVSMTTDRVITTGQVYWIVVKRPVGMSDSAPADQGVVVAACQMLGDTAGTALTLLNNAMAIDVEQGDKFEVYAYSLQAASILKSQHATWPNQKDVLHIAFISAGSGLEGN